MDFNKAKDYILKRLENELHPNLFYHSIDHTMDVYHSAVKIAEEEGVSGDDMTLIKTAAMFHDSGMIRTYVGHEEASADIAKESLGQFGYDEIAIEIIAKLIMTTKLPQQADTFLEKIICDADLDYLGREDFIMISHRLRHEWVTQKINVLSLKQWYELQIEFLTSHTYFTEYAALTREKGKQENLQQIQELLNK